MSTESNIFWILAGSLLVFLLGMLEDGAAQVMGNLAEMDRLEQRAEELAVQADPEGASQAMGKAARWLIF